MAQIIIDSDAPSELISAIQTIVDIISTEKKNRKATEDDRDKLLNQIKMLEYERQQFMQMKCSSSPSDDAMVTNLNESLRKRMKTEQTKQSTLNQTAHDISNDDLNAAFHEDDVVGPSLFPPLNISIHKSKKISPANRDKALKEQNKENDDAIVNRKPSPTVIEKSPTVLTKHISKLDSKANEAAGWHPTVSKRNNTPKRLFDNWIATKDALPSQPIKANSSARKKPSLSLNLNASKLKQSTITFTKKKDEEETFCEGVSLGMSDNLLPETSINSDLADTSMLSVSRDPECLLTNDDSVRLEICSNEVIMIDESQSTQELYRFVANIKEELAEDSSPNPKDQSLVNPIKTPPKVNNPSANNILGFDCKECREYHRMLGRDVEKNPPKKFGVCYKHKRTYQGAETPPGFWNPTIDSDSDQEETPFDPRFVKNKLK